MDELIKINYEAENLTVSARELYEGLEIKTAFKDWFPRMTEYGFAEGTDFNPLKNEQVRLEGSREVRRELVDYQISVDMAKQICMIQRTEKGRQYRQYFLDLEKAWQYAGAGVCQSLEDGRSGDRKAEIQQRRSDGRCSADAPEGDLRGCSIHEPHIHHGR